MDNGIDADEVVKVLKTANKMNEISLEDVAKYDDIVESVFTHKNMSDSLEFKEIYQKYLDDKENRLKNLKAVEERRKDTIASMKALCDKYKIDYGTIY